MNPTDPYETGFPKKGTYEKIPYHDSVGDLGFRHLSLGLTQRVKKSFISPLRKIHFVPNLLFITGLYTAARSVIPRAYILASGRHLNPKP